MTPLDDTPGIFPAHAEAPFREASTQGNKRFWATTVVLAAAFGIYFFVSRPPDKPEGWGEDFKLAMAQAHAANKNVVVDFYLEECPPCKAMDRVVFPNEDVRKALCEFVPVRLNGVTNLEIAQKYQVFATPTYLVLNVNGDVLARTEGFIPAGEFIAFLNDAQRAAPKPPQAAP
ncbi:MAG: thioredoxin fold domain-containing protein [Planctomycetes bacterium]|nr:thioredoxin fold domain-containing protein [Planctomycetota bacterium]MBI3836207.1 thioredoxin fold domain-containing protein [Planctomycetota bacterium]